MIALFYFRFEHSKDDAVVIADTDKFTSVWTIPEDAELVLEGDDPYDLLDEARGAKVDLPATVEARINVWEGYGRY